MKSHDWKEVQKELEVQKEKFCINILAPLSAGSMAFSLKYNSIY